MFLVRLLIVSVGFHGMASSANNGGKPWTNRRERNQYFINMQANASRNQNANTNPPWGPQQQWFLYQQHAFPPQVAYVPMMIYGAQPFGSNPYNQWSNGNQYMPSIPSMPTPYPAAVNSSWGQPAPSMPHQQAPYTGNQAWQRATPRQPPPGFVSEENESASASANVGAGSQTPVPQDRETHVDGGSNQPGTPQAPVGLPGTSTRASAKTTTVPPRSGIGGKDNDSELSARIHDVQQITVSEIWLEEKEPSIKDTASNSGPEGSRSHPPLNIFASVKPEELELTEHLESSKTTVALLKPRGSGWTERPTTSTSTVVAQMQSSPLSEYQNPPRRFARKVNVRQSITPPLGNKRKRMTPSHIDSEDESNEENLPQPLPATKSSQCETEQLQKSLQDEALPVTKQVPRAKQMRKGLQKSSLQPCLRRSTRGSTKPFNYYREITSEEADAMMLSSQDTSTFERNESQAQSIDDEFNRSDISFHPESPESEVFANDLE